MIHIPAHEIPPAPCKPGATAEERIGRLERHNTWLLERLALARAERDGLRVERDRAYIFAVVGLIGWLIGNLIWGSP